MVLPTNSDFLCSSPQHPAYHFYKMLIPSSYLLSFPLPFLHHIHHHVPCMAFISPFKTWSFTSLHSYLSSFWSWFGPQIHRSGETSSVPVQHWAELLQEGLSHDRDSLDAGVRSVVPSPLWLQYYRYVTSRTIARREGVEMELSCVRPGHLTWVLQTFQVRGNFRELESTL